MKSVVMKFGGSSISDDEKIKQVANLIAKYYNQGVLPVVVVSAIEGVTNSLEVMSEDAKKGQEKKFNKLIKKILQTHSNILRNVIRKKTVSAAIEAYITTTIEELMKVLTGIMFVGELTKKSKDYVLSFGEKLSAPIISGVLQDQGIHSTYLTGKEAGIITDSNYGEASPIMKLIKKQVKIKLLPLLKKRIVPVVTGYIGASKEGHVTTLGRGGSDYTATIIGAALGVDEIWIFTDVDGLMTFDPKLLSSAKLIPEISFQEATEMTIFGAKSMHPRALEPARENNIPVRIRNTFNPDNPGTLILDKQKVNSGDIVKAISLVKDVALVNISGSGMIGRPGTAAKVFSVVGKEDINILMISQSVSEASISFIIQQKKLQKAVEALTTELKSKGLIHDVTAESEVCVVAAVGVGMKSTPGVASRIFKAIAKKGINIRMIAQGSSEMNISFAVREDDGLEAVKAIHDEFKLNNK